MIKGNHSHALNTYCCLKWRGFALNSLVFSWSFLLFVTLLTRLAGNERPGYPTAAENLKEWGKSNGKLETWVLIPSWIETSLYWNQCSFIFQPSLFPLLLQSQSLIDRSRSTSSQRHLDRDTISSPCSLHPTFPHRRVQPTLLQARGYSAIVNVKKSSSTTQNIWHEAKGVYFSPRRAYSLPV